MTGITLILILFGLSWTTSHKYQEECSRSVMNYPHSWNVYAKLTNVTVCRFTVERNLRHCDEFTNLNSAAYCQRAFENFVKKIEIDIRWTHYSDDQVRYCIYANSADKKIIASLTNFSAEVNLLDDRIQLQNVFTNYSAGYYRPNDGEIFVWETRERGDFWTQSFSCNSLELVGTVDFVGYISNQRRRYRILEYENEAFAAELSEKPNVTCDGKNPTIWYSKHHSTAFIESGYNLRNRKHPLPSRFEEYFLQQAAVYREILGKCHFPDDKKPETNLIAVFCILGIISCYILLHFFVTLYNMFTNYATFKNANYKGPVHLLQGQVNRFYFFSIRDLMWKAKIRANEEKAHEIIQRPENNYEYVSSEYDYNYLYNKNVWDLDK